MEISADGFPSWIPAMVCAHHGDVKTKVHDAHTRHGRAQQSFNWTENSSMERVRSAGNELSANVRWNKNQNEYFDGKWNPFGTHMDELSLMNLIKGCEQSENPALNQLLSLKTMECFVWSKCKESTQRTNNRVFWSLCQWQLHYFMNVLHENWRPMHGMPSLNNSHGHRSLRNSPGAKFQLQFLWIFYAQRA